MANTRFEQKVHVFAFGSDKRPPPTPGIRHGRCVSRGSLHDQLQCFAGADDADALVGLNVAQMPVAGDDEIGACGDGAGDDLVVIGIGEDHRVDAGGNYALRELRVAANQALDAHV